VSGGGRARRGATTTCRPEALAATMSASKSLSVSKSNSISSRS
jgi:hypothetical protein